MNVCNDLAEAMKALDGKKKRELMGVLHIAGHGVLLP